MIYAAYLHARATAGWRGKAAAVIALIGFASLLFNFVGINFFFGVRDRADQAAVVVGDQDQLPARLVQSRHRLQDAGALGQDIERDVADQGHTAYSAGR